MLLPWGWAVAFVFAALAAGLMGWRARRAFGGQTGDVLGAIQQMAEIGVLAAAVAAA
jgi:adenosylcobinamide-GDP ribazoletransferase